MQLNSIINYAARQIYVDFTLYQYIWKHGHCNTHYIISHCENVIAHAWQKNYYNICHPTALSVISYYFDLYKNNYRNIHCIYYQLSCNNINRYSMSKLKESWLQNKEWVAVMFHVKHSNSISLNIKILLRVTIS